MMAMVIMTVAITALCELLAAGTTANISGNELTTAVNQANTIHEQAIGLPLSHSRDAVIGPWHDVWDLNGQTFSPPIDAARRPISTYGNWTQRITVQSVDSNNISSPIADDRNAPTARLTVEILQRRAARCIPQAGWLRRASRSKLLRLFRIDPTAVAGVAYVLAMLYMLLFTVLGIGFYATASTISVQIAKNDRSAADAQAAAESGMEFVRYQLGQLRIPTDTSDANLCHPRSPASLAARPRRLGDHEWPCGADERDDHPPARRNRQHHTRRRRWHPVSSSRSPRRADRWFMPRSSVTEAARRSAGPFKCSSAGHPGRKMATG